MPTLGRVYVAKPSHGPQGRCCTCRAARGGIHHRASSQPGPCRPVHPRASPRVNRRRRRRALDPAGPTRWPTTATAACRPATSTSTGRSPPTSGSRRVVARHRPRRAGTGAQRARRARGLRPGAEYFYRFRAAGHISPVGRTRTAPAPGSLAPLTMCFASCSHYERATSPPTAGSPRSSPTWSCTSATTCTSTRRRDERRCAPARRPGDRDARRLPARLRPVQDRPGPAGRPRRRAVARRLRRPRGREQLGRRRARPKPRARRSWTAAPRRSRPTTRTCRCAASAMPQRHRHPAVPARPVGRSGDVPHARHPPVPRRPGLRRRLRADCAERPRPGAHADRASSRNAGCSTASRGRAPAGTSSASRSSSRQLRHDAGPAAVSTWTRGTATRATATGSSPARRRRRPQPRRPHRRRPHALGRRGHERFDDPSSPVVATELVTTSITSDGDGSDRDATRRPRCSPRTRTSYYSDRARLHPDPRHRRRTAGRLQGGAVCLPPRCPGTHRGIIRRRRRRARSARDVSSSGARNADSPSGFASRRPRSPTAIGEGADGGIAGVQDSRVGAVAVEIRPGGLRLDVCPGCRCTD